MKFEQEAARFIQGAPACVMARALMERVFRPADLDALFKEVAVTQYERTLLFSSMVRLMFLVASRAKGAVRSAYLGMRDEVTVSMEALYTKLARVEIATSRALVQHSARIVGQTIDRCQGKRQSLLKGYKVRVLDGNHLRGTEHRLKVLRKTKAGALPGQSLALLDPQRRLIEDVILCEDGHAQERSLLDQVLPCIQPRSVIIADRNFCTLGFLFGLMQRKAYFVIRQHGQMPWKLAGKPQYIGRCATGRVYEGTAELRDPETGQTVQVRYVTVKLKAPTRDGDMELHLFTNLPRKVDPVRVATLYSNRWTIETAFQELTVQHRCELKTLGYPRAALFSFSVAVCAYNVLAAIFGALRSVHGEEVEKKVSSYFITTEISSTYGGMMLQVPPDAWQPFQEMSLARLATFLRRCIRTADLTAYPKAPRGPKKPKEKLASAQFQHVATAKLLEAERAKRKTKPKPKRPKQNQSP